MEARAVAIRATTTPTSPAPTSMSASHCGIAMSMDILNDPGGEQKADFPTDTLAATQKPEFGGLCAPIQHRPTRSPVSDAGIDNLLAQPDHYTIDQIHRTSNSARPLSRTGARAAFAQ